MERLTAQDLLMLWADDFGWSEDIGVLAVLDGDRLLDSEGRVRVDEVRRRLEARLHLVPRLRQLLYRPRWGLGWPLWVDAASFDLADHVRAHPLAPPGDEAHMLAACAELYRRRLDPARPLWEAWLLPGLPGLLGDNLRRRLRGLGRGLSGLARGGGRRPASLGVWREFFAERAPCTSLNRPIGAGRRLAVVRGRLEVARRVAHAHQAKVNDVVLAAVAGGLRQLLAGRGEDVQELALRVMVPVSLHREQPGPASGNRDAVMLVPLPLGEADPVRRLERIAAETAARKGKARPPMGGGLFGLVAVQRGWYRLLARQRTVNLVVTNVPGPPVPLYLAGARLLELFPVAAIMGNLTLAVAVLSYAGQLNLTAIADRDSCPDLQVFAEGMQAALDDLERSVCHTEAMGRNLLLR